MNRGGRHGWSAHGAADFAVTATAERLYLALWNRADLHALDHAGNAGVLDLWRAGARWEI